MPVAAEGGLQALVNRLVAAVVTASERHQIAQTGAEYTSSVIRAALKLTNDAMDLLVEPLSTLLSAPKEVQELLQLAASSTPEETEQQSPATGE